MKTIRLTCLLLVLLAVGACSKDEGSDDPVSTTPSTPTVENVIEITYKVEADGYSITEVRGDVEYADADGIVETTISGPWEKTVKVPRGHNLFFRVDGTIVQGNVVIRASAVDTENGEVVFTDQLSYSTPFGTDADFDFTLKGNNLGN